MKQRTFWMFAVPVVSLVAFSAPVASDGQGLPTRTDKAPIVPDGTTAGADTDFVVTFADRDPDVPGIDIKTGGTIAIQLPEEFVQDDPTEPLTMVVLQGWPQSPRMPFPNVTYDATTNTLTGTMGFDYLYQSSENPGPKQAHLLLPGFTNPRAGKYWLKVTIQPDPAEPAVLTDYAFVRIRRNVRPSINAISVINGSPPPPFPNSIYQTIAAGDTPLQWGFYLWERGGDPSVGVVLEQLTEKHYAIKDAAGDLIGDVKIRAPRRSSGFVIEADASVLANAAVLGVPTGLLTAQFRPDPDTRGNYVIRWKLNGGNTQKMFLTVT